jgi:hypothetical protein
MKKFARILLVALLGFALGGTASALGTSGTFPPGACSGSC